MLDQAYVNPRILYLCKHANNQQKMKMSAASTLKPLVLHLVKPHLLDRLQNPMPRLDLKKGIQNILEFNDAFGPQLNKRAICELCPSKKDKKTSNQCSSCLLPMCDYHQAYLCSDCSGYQS